MKEERKQVVIDGVNYEPELEVSGFKVGDWVSYTCSATSFKILYGKILGIDRRFDNLIIKFFDNDIVEIANTYGLEKLNLELDCMDDILYEFIVSDCNPSVFFK